MKSISPAISGKTFARRAELFFLIVVSSPRRRFSEPEADQEKETSLCGSNERSEWVVQKGPKAFPL
jgi:hypothetical protein